MIKEYSDLQFTYSRLEYLKQLEHYEYYREYLLIVEKIEADRYATPKVVMPL